MAALQKTRLVARRWAKYEPSQSKWISNKYWHIVCWSNGCGPIFVHEQMSFCTLHRNGPFRKKPTGFEGAESWGLDWCPSTIQIQLPPPQRTRRRPWGLGWRVSSSSRSRSTTFRNFAASRLFLKTYPPSAVNKMWHYDVILELHHTATCIFSNIFQLWFPKLFRGQTLIHSFFNDTREMWLG